MMRFTLRRLLGCAILLCMAHGVAFAGTPSVASPTPSTTPMLPSPLPAHPRLFASPADWDALKTRITADPVTGRIFQALKLRAEKYLTQEPLHREMEGRRLLHTSRACLERVSTLAMVAQVTGDERFTKRAVQEMQAAAAFKDWNPSHFLDVGEMSLALAIGYDWLYQKMTPEERTTIAKALMEKGVGPTWEGAPAHWITATNNWNQVCHAGITIAALAIAEDNPEMAEKTLRRAVDNIGKCANAYAPDGAYPEGPMYWGYGTSFHVTLISAVQHLTGKTQGLEDYPGFEKSGDYVMQMCTPTEKFWSYSDCRANRGFEITLFWFAGRYARPDLIAYEVKHLDSAMSRYETSPKSNDGMRLLPLTLFWWKPETNPNARPPEPEPLHWLGHGPVPVSVHRSAWGDTKALFAGIKGGHPGYSHGHMDEGSFILESDGVQWATDLGMEEYNRLESIGVNLWNSSQHGQRWDVFRLGPDSHNILRFNGKQQKVEDKSDIVRFSTEGSQPHTVVDLTPSYPGQVASVQRGLAMLDGKAFLLQDDWKTLPAGTQGAAPTTVDWQMLTLAEKIEIADDKRSATLHKEGQTLSLLILSPDKVDILVQDAEKPRRPYDAENPGAKVLIIRTVAAPDKEGSLRILAVPGSSGKASDFPKPAAVKVLDWSKPLPRGK